MACSPPRALTGRNRSEILSRSRARTLDDDIAGDDDDDDDGVDETEHRSISRAVERERFLKIGTTDLKKAHNSSGRFDVLKFYAIHKREFPIHFVLALCFFGALCSEANVERVFSYTGGVMSAKRASLSAAMLQAMVFVSQNASFFPFTTEEL